jgi:hypothetical protein
MRAITALAIVAATLLSLRSPGTAWAQQAKIEEVTNLDATVESVDEQGRTVLLRVPDGLATVAVPPEVKNFAQIRAGDRVHIELKEALVAKLTTADPNAQPKTNSEFLTAPPGAKPGAFERESIRANVRITGIDQASHTVRFVGPAGVERVTHLQDPSMQAMLQKLNVGDVVEMTYSVALAAIVRPM